MKTKTLFLGMDISKLTIDYSLIDSMDKVILGGQIANTATGLSDLLKTLKSAGYKDLGLILFGMENTGTPSQGYIQILLRFMLSVKD